ncbi:MAG TPA: LysE family transporter [Thermoanaerobaculia bacterium]
MESSLTSVVVHGLLLGWSVAWPPGPVNAEMIRRGLTAGFGSAVAVGLGASSGDFLWAAAVALGAGSLAGLPGVRPALGAISLALLLFLAWTFFRGAWRSWQRQRAGAAPAPMTGRFDSTHGGFVLGLTMALSSPWNLAFWLAVIGQQAGTTLSLGRSLVLATAVVTAAVAWTFFLCTGVRLGARFATPAWEIGTSAGTGLLMLYFAARLVVRLAA